MSDTFRTKAQHFAQQVISDVKATSIVKPAEQSSVEPEQPAVQQPPQSVGEPTGNEPQAYHEENRVSEFGKKFSIFKACKVQFQQHTFLFDTLYRPIVFGTFTVV